MKPDRAGAPALTLATLAILTAVILASRDSSGVGPPGNGGGSAPGTQGCLDGKEKGSETAGHCCWAGQVWSASKCVGVPTACPKGRALDPAKELCALAACAAGMVRPANNRNQCCWPGQAWSKARDACVGVPRSCPATHEVVGETCVSLDLDGDGIPNKVDKCPTEPEDFNGFEDADGCPDEARLQAKRRAEADAERQVRDEAARRERERQEIQERLERAKREEEEQRLARIAEEEQRRRAEHAALVEAARAKAQDRRSTGRICVGYGAASLAAMGIFLGVGAAQNSRIQAGGFMTASDIEGAASLGKTMNILAGVFGAAGGALLAAGIPLIVVSRDPKDADVTPAPPAPPLASLGLGPAGLVARGAF